MKAFYFFNRAIPQCEDFLKLKFDFNMLKYCKMGFNEDNDLS